jgi:Cu(I)/Ag(I) efflux system protein CusF
MKSTAVAFVLPLLFSMPSLAQHSHGPSHHAPGTAAAAPASSAGGAVAMSDGEVKKVDKAAGKVTIKHGPLEHLDMPAMTMVFRVKDSAMLDQLKAGETIRFKAEKVDGNYTVTEFQPAK